MILLYYVTNIEKMTFNTVKMENSVSSQTAQVRKQTVIEYDKTYQKYISNLSEAQKEIKKEGVRQREKYTNQPITEIERKDRKSVV